MVVPPFPFLGLSKTRVEGLHLNPDKNLIGEIQGRFSQSIRRKRESSWNGCVEKSQCTVGDIKGGKTIG
jgi:hypothetical protein